MFAGEDVGLIAGYNNYFMILMRLAYLSHYLYILSNY